MWAGCLCHGHVVTRGPIVARAVVQYSGHTVVGGTTVAIVYEARFLRELGQ